MKIESEPFRIPTVSAQFVADVRKYGGSASLVKQLETIVIPAGVQSIDDIVVPVEGASTDDPSDDLVTVGDEAGATGHGEQRAPASSAARIYRSNDHSLGFWFARIAGADPRLIVFSPPDKIRFAGLGISILASGALVALAVYFSLMLASAPQYVALLLALFSLLFAVYVERSFTVASSYRTRARAYLGKLAIGMLGSLLLAVCLALPIALRIFDTEIQTYVPVLREQQVAELQTSASLAYSRQLDALDLEISRIRSDLETELSGQGTSGLVGGGPLYEQKLQQLLDAEDTRSRLIARQSEEIAEIQTPAGSPGIVERLQAFDIAVSSTPSLVVIFYFVVLVIALVLLMPIIAMAARSGRVPTLYERLLSLNEQYTLADFDLRTMQSELRRDLARSAADPAIEERLGNLENKMNQRLRSSEERAFTKIIKDYYETTT